MEEIKQAPIEEIKQAQLSHEVPAFPTRPMTYSEGSRQTVQRGLTTALRSQAIDLIKREIGVLASGQTQGAIFR